MGRNYAITIGINGYRYLQRLNYAQHDANAVRQLFLQELGFQQVYHFTDNSPDIPQDYGPDLESRPTFTTLERFLDTRFDQPFLRDGDNLWFFFAGHGIRYQNRDYLVPIDGDRGRLERSAIPIHYISERLRRSGADNVILLIDACRSFEGKRDGFGIGVEKQQGVITLFSCSPEESSYEIEELRQGAFTHALLEILRRQGEGNCATVERLYQQLRYYVPQITRHYKRVAQTPYGVIEPPTKNHLILLPQSATLADIMTLKYDAVQAELRQDLKQAKRYWVRVLAASPADPEAIEGIERITNLKTIETSPSEYPELPLTSRSGEVSFSTALSKDTRYQSAEDSMDTLRNESRGSETFVSRRGLLSLIPTNFLTIFGMGTLVALCIAAIQSLFSNLFYSKSSSNSERPDSAETTSANEPQLEATDFEQIEIEVVTVREDGDPATFETKKVQVFQEAIGDTVLEMVAIPSGEFMMGQTESEKEELIRLVGEDDYQRFYTDELPQHLVTVPQFLMGKYQVTQAQYQAVMGNNPSSSTDNGTNRPVENVTWNDAVEFCQKLSQQTGREYRLPSEAEWEYACRAGTTTPFHFGPTITTDLANYDGTATYGSGPKGEYRQQTTEVGSFPPNTFGLYDAHGNVWEWCLDHWHDSYEGAPTDGSAWTTGGDESRRVLRGGSWYVDPRYCRSADRFRDARDFTYFNHGFRVVCASSWALS
jgi:formylglycine-generating enzyme required for sulfatase activity/uncharacterized caspase-like protein